MTLIPIHVLSEGGSRSPLNRYLLGSWWLQVVLEAPATKNETPPAIALNIRVPQIAKRGFWFTDSCSKFNLWFSWSWWEERGHLWGRSQGDPINMQPALGEVTVLRCTWLNYGFECDHPLRLNEDKREPLAITGSTGAWVEMHGGSSAGKTVTGWNSFLMVIR